MHHASNAADVPPVQKAEGTSTASRIAFCICRRLACAAFASARLWHVSPHGMSTLLISLSPWTRGARGARGARFPRPSRFPPFQTCRSPPAGAAVDRLSCREDVADFVHVVDPVDGLVPRHPAYVRRSRDDIDDVQTRVESQSVRHVMRNNPRARAVVVVVFFLFFWYFSFRSILLVLFFSFVLSSRSGVFSVSSFMCVLLRLPGAECIGKWVV